MFPNTYHDLLHQLSEVLDSLWRMREYKENAEKEGRPEIKEFWEKMEKMLQQEVEMLKEQLEKLIK